jgi:uncharacterized SAM-binding protein YcdF (DUF218 family)
MKVASFRRLSENISLVLSFLFLHFLHAGYIIFGGLSVFSTVVNSHLMITLSQLSQIVWVGCCRL